MNLTRLYFIGAIVLDGTFGEWRISVAFVTLILASLSMGFIEIGISSYLSDKKIFGNIASIFLFYCVAVIFSLLILDAFIIELFNNYLFALAVCSTILVPFNSLKLARMRRAYCYRAIAFNKSSADVLLLVVTIVLIYFANEIFLLAIPPIISSVYTFFYIKTYKLRFYFNLKNSLAVLAKTKYLALTSLSNNFANNLFLFFGQLVFGFGAIGQYSMGKVGASICINSLATAIHDYSLSYLRFDPNKISVRLSNILKIQTSIIIPFYSIAIIIAPKVEMFLFNGKWGQGIFIAQLLLLGEVLKNFVFPSNYFLISKNKTFKILMFSVTRCIFYYISFFFLSKVYTFELGYVVSSLVFLDCILLLVLNFYLMVKFHPELKGVYDELYFRKLSIPLFCICCAFISFFFPYYLIFSSLAFFGLIWGSIWTFFDGREH